MSRDLAKEALKGGNGTVKVCIIGLGYIGFPTACVVSRAGHEVVGVDVNAEIINKLNNGELHIVNENGLGDIARQAFESGSLRVATEPEPADVFILAVPTPYRKLVLGGVSPAAHREIAAALDEQDSRADLWKGSEPKAEVEGPQFGADLTFVEESTREILPYVRPGNLVVLESTVSPGTTERLVCGILERETGLVCGRDIFVAHAPERVLPGRILEELTNNDRVVGGISKESTELAVSFYRTFVRGQVVGTDATTAELVKLMENTFRDVNIALANEFALVCEKLGINVFEAIELANRHPRVNILKPGPGVGGHCIAVDPYFIAEAAPEEARLISLARRINSSMPHHVVDLVREMAESARQAGKTLRRVIALGASYKPNVGDERESPSLEIVSLLEQEGYEVFVHDPYISRFSQESLANLIEGADLLMMLTDHQVYRSELRPAETKQRMRQALVLDTRGFFGQEWDDTGFRVVRLGVGKRH